MSSFRTTAERVKMSKVALALSAKVWEISKYNAFRDETKSLYIFFDDL